MIEAEIHARVRDRDAVLAALRARADGEESIYHDRYFDRPDGSLVGAGYEIRTRTVETAGYKRSRFTFKEPAVEHTAGSKPEHETTVGDPTVIETLLAQLGLVEHVAFAKHCVNFAVDHHGQHIQTTVVTVPEIDGDFIEAEIQVPRVADVEPALAVISGYLATLGITADDHTMDTYTESVRRARGLSPR